MAVLVMKIESRPEVLPKAGGLTKGGPVLWCHKVKKGLPVACGTTEMRQRLFCCLTNWLHPHLCFYL